MKISINDIELGKHEVIGSRAAISKHTLVKAGIATIIFITIGSQFYTVIKNAGVMFIPGMDVGAELLKGIGFFLFMGAVPLVLVGISIYHNLKGKGHK